MASSLTVSQLFTYSWRVDKFIQKYESGEPFELMNRRTVNLQIEEDILQTLKSKNRNEYNKIRFTDAKVKSKKYKFSDFIKNVEFGGKPDGPAAGIDEEERQVANINAQLNEIMAKKNVKSVKLKVGSKYYDVVRAGKVEGTPKADLALFDEKGNEVVWISYKKGSGPRDFQQWGGMTEPEISVFTEIQEFVNQIQEKYKGVMPRATTIAKKIKKDELKNRSVYGVNYTSPGKNLGQKNVSILLQGDIKLRQIGNAHQMISNHTSYNGDSQIGEYEPVLMATYKGPDRNQFGIKGARFTIQPKGSRKIKEWLD
jgi:hypothetical protein